MTDPTSGERTGEPELLTELADDFAHRYRRGERPTVDEYAQRYPALAGQIQELFPALLVMEQSSVDWSLNAAPSTERVGATVGRYKLLERLGEGGFGVVFMAEQLTPVRRKVALKLIKPGLDTRQVVARFEAERQALALMDHENIAKVLDVGATDSGRPYFVMELVRGVPITDYCDRNRLAPRGRLELFVQVCRAVQHAHTKGVIHRDIKPTNVLVTLMDGVPVPKVIDFGVAKAVGEQRLTERTLFTNFAQMVGTPLYMSPEQAEMSGLDVDTRSDVYGLGVLLYELLTGTTPFDRNRLREAAHDEVRRIIREEEPPAPSTRISTLGDALGSVSANCGTDPKRLGQLVRGELDWIVMRAMAKDRTRRYETANGLARDVERYLADEPVEACPPSAWYRFRKFAARYKRALAAAAFAGALLVLAAVALTVSTVRTAAAYRRADENYQTAERQRALAQHHATEAEAQRRLAVAQTARVVDREQWTTRALYVAHMNLAQQAVEAADAARATDWLQLYLPRRGTQDLRGFEWHYWWRLCHHRLRRTMTANADRINGVAYSPDGTLLAACGHDNIVRLWVVKSGEEWFAFRGHRGPVQAVAFAPDGATIASASQDGTARLWDVKTGAQKVVLEGHNDTITAVCFSPDGRTVGTASDDRTVRLWDAASGRLATTLRGHTAAVMSIAFTPDGATLASGSGYLAKPGEVILWDLTKRQPTRTLAVSHGQATAVAFSPDGKLLAAGTYTVPHGEGSPVYLWDTATGELKKRLDARGQGLFAARFSSDGKSLAAAGEDRVLRVWDVASGSVKFSLMGQGYVISALDFSRDCATVATGSSDGAVRLWDVASPDPTTRLLANMPVEADLPYSVSAQHAVFSPGGRRARVHRRRPHR